MIELVVSLPLYKLLPTTSLVIQHIIVNLLVCTNYFYNVAGG